MNLVQIYNPTTNPIYYKKKLFKLSLSSLTPMTTKEGQVSNLIGIAATKLANEISATSILSFERSASDLYSDSLYHEIKVSLFKKVGYSQYIKTEYKTKIKKPSLGSMIPIKELIAEAYYNKYLSKGETIVCIQDDSFDNGFKGYLSIINIDALFSDNNTSILYENVHPDIIDSIIEIALEISKYGREGKKVGTAFIIGPKEILKYSKQLIINPFQYIEPEKKKITDLELRETIKEFSQLDGVFMIDNDGTILSSGTYIDIDTEGLNLPQGLGTKHRNCAAITAKTSAIAFVVSSSGGKIKVFKNGKIVMTI